MPDNQMAVYLLREELNPKGIHVAVIELDGPGGGNPFVRLRGNSPVALRRWLDRNGYKDERLVNALNPNWVPRKTAVGTIGEERTQNRLVDYDKG